MNYRLLLPLILLFGTFTAQAEARWFEVELLLFQRNVDIADINEDLAAENSTVDTVNSISLFKTQENELCVAGAPCLHESNPVLINNALFDTQTNGFQQLDASHLQLTPQREKLDRHASFMPVLHLAWRMPVASKKDAIPLHIFAGKNLALTYPHATRADSLNGEESDITEGRELEQEFVNNIINVRIPAPLTDKWEIDGNFKIYLDHYLFIDSQLLIRQAVTNDITAINLEQAQNFEIVNSDSDLQVIKQIETEKEVNIRQNTIINETLFDQNRRLRSEEIHYFDHPLMGMIVQIRKIQTTEEENQ